MIDYEKLKLAHNLAHGDTGLYFTITLGVYTFPIFTIIDTNGVVIYSCKDIDELIIQLKNLTKSTTE